MLKQFDLGSGQDTSAHTNVDKCATLLTKLMVEAERESVRELVNLVERLSSRDSRDSMTRYQELSALMEVSAILTE